MLLAAGVATHSCLQGSALHPCRGVAVGHTQRHASTNPGSRRANYGTCLLLRLLRYMVQVPDRASRQSMPKEQNICRQRCQRA